MILRSSHQEYHNEKLIAFASTISGDEDLIDVTDYLLTMDSNTHLEVYHLALILGLSQSRVKGMMESPIFLDDVIAAWLRREDQVPKRGVPTWENLVKALRHPRLKQNEIADKIANEKLIHL